MKLLAEQAYFLWTESFVGYLDLVDWKLQIMHDCLQHVIKWSTYTTYRRNPLNHI